MDVLLLHCAESFPAHKGLFLVFFLGGLTGGFTHCFAMCGPISACQSLCASASCTAGRVARISQWRYHLGRATAYGALGFLAALLSRQIAASPYWPAVASAMLAVAGAMFIAGSLPRCHRHPAFSGPIGYLRGLLLGFMPCGLLYAAVMMAATLADPISGMVAMWLFTLGTIPALLAASLSAELFLWKWREPARQAGRAIMAFNGLSLLVMAERIIK